jgi:dimethylhistidine N-methyltransferase
MSRIAEKWPPPHSLEEGSTAKAVLAGLSRPQKTLPSFLFYDGRGSELFEKITQLPEYYLTRVETAILEAAAGEIALHTLPGAVLVEFGSGSSRKTEILLGALPKLSAYVPIDVSQSALDEACARISGHFPDLRVIPTLGDFGEPLFLPESVGQGQRVGFFPGSTIGNFVPDDARDLLSHMARTLGASSKLVTGVDLRKDLSILLPAYDDAAGVTAEFNANILARLNREMGADFDLRRFDHKVTFNASEGRIEMHLVSRRAQRVSVLGRNFYFLEGESIHTENSYKYTILQFQQLAERAGWSHCNVWTDPESLFSLHEMAASP